MKIIRVTEAGDNTPAIDFLPDSTLLRRGYPMFYPDFGSGWSIEPYLAVRLSRLGKGVSLKFATRYYDAVAPAIRLILPGAPAVMQGALSGMDFSVSHGDWRTPVEYLEAGSITIQDVEIPLPSSTEEIDRMIPHVSRLTTIKMGDIILLPLGAQPIPVGPRSRIKAMTPDGTEVMDVKVV
ncbi:MAG: hypothetical protein HFJ91_04645 [Muribaculaceae bacterium]|nr:hypothetical protein [Muribaculaceae bacterium]